MVTENNKRIFFIFSILNQSQHTAADFYLSPYIILLYNLLIPKPKKVVITLSKIVTGMRPIIAAVGKFIYSSKAKISLLKFQSFSNKFFAIPFNKPETTLHESPAKTEAVRIASKWQVVISLQPYKKKALFHISKTELFSYSLSVQACQLRIGWLSPVKVNQASCLNNLPLVVNGIWLSIPIGWALADILGILLLKNNLRQEWKQLQVQLFVNKKAKYPKI